MIDVIVEAEAWSALPDLEALVTRAAATVTQISDEASVLLTDDAALQALNKQFRGQDKPTNVLSFEDDDPGTYLGDIAIAFETVQREASADGKSLADHLTHLVIHGCLHLQGEDHETDTEAEHMERQEIAALASLGIANPYAALD